MPEIKNSFGRIWQMFEIVFLVKNRQFKKDIIQAAIWLVLSMISPCGLPCSVTKKFFSFPASGIQVVELKPQQHLNLLPAITLAHFSNNSGFKLRCENPYSSGGIEVVSYNNFLPYICVKKFVLCITKIS